MDHKAQTVDRRQNEGGAGIHLVLAVGIQPKNDFPWGTNKRGNVLTLPPEQIPSLKGLLDDMARVERPAHSQGPHHATVRDAAEEAIRKIS